VHRIFKTFGIPSKDQTYEIEEREEVDAKCIDSLFND
jgi:hypothetical protein